MWTPDEVRAALDGDDTLTAAACAWWGITPGGNFEGESIANRSPPRRDLLRPPEIEAARQNYRLLAEGVAIGRAIGLEPKAEYVSRYRRAFRLETRPVQPPALVSEPGHGSDEAVYLLLEMVAIAERARVPVPRLRAARDTLIRPREITVPVTDITDETATV